MMISGKSVNFCSSCCQSYSEKESKKKYVYTGCDIYVKMVSLTLLFVFVAT